MRCTLSIVAAMLCVQPAVAQGWKPDVQLKALLTDLELAKR